MHVDKIGPMRPTQNPVYVCENERTLQWRHTERDGVPNHQPHNCLLNRWFKVQIKENIKVPHHGPLWGEFTGDRWITRSKGQ